MTLVGWASERVRALFNPGEEALNVPPLDGPLKPNDALQQAAVLATLEQADALARRGEEVLVSAGRGLWSLRGSEQTLLAELEQPLTALAVLPDGGLAVGLDGVGLRFLGGARDGQQVTELAGAGLGCVTDLAVVEGALVLCQGSREHRAEQWQHNLMGKRRDGRVARLSLETLRGEVLAEGLGWPAGVAALPGGELLVSVAWEHRLARLAPGGTLRTAWKNMPGYPGRARAARGGGFWLPAFAMRTKLVEFVLQEDQYRQAMMAQIEPRYWVVPALAALDDHWEPLQGGGIKQLGISKPWAPPRSYGLVVRLDPDLEPVASLHSRANARRHGVTGVLELDAQLLCTSRGNGLVLQVPLPAPGSRPP